MTLSFVTYLLLSGLGLFIFSMADKFYLHRRLSLPHRRLFYISALVVGLIMPWASMIYPHKLLTTVTAEAEADFVIDTDLSVLAVEEATKPMGLLSHLSMSDILLALWGIGVAVMIVRLVYGLIRVLTIIRTSESTLSPSGRRIHLTDKTPNPFSFMGMIVLPRQVYEDTRCRDLILRHEEAHCSQRHHYDLIVDQLCLIVHWWNPFAWMLTNAHYNTLEYLADSHVLDTGVDRKAYQRQLLESSLKIPAESLSLSFSVYNLKKRIKMMNNNTTPHRPLIQSLRMVSALLLVSAGLFVGSNVMAVPAPITDSQENLAPQTPPVRDEGTVYEKAEQMPVYKGGDKQLMKDLAKLVVYPKEAAEKGIQGRVLVGFIVDEQGNVVEPQVTEKVHPLLDAEALRVVKLLKYIPGKVKGQPVRCRFSLPVRFAIPSAIVEKTAPSKPLSVEEFRRMLGSLLKSNLHPNDDNVSVKFRIVNGKAQDIEIKTTDEKVKGALLSFIRKQTFKPEKNSAERLYFSFDIDRKKAIGDNEAHTYLEEMPEFEGGDKAMMEHLAKVIIYPKEAADKKIQGRVMVSFVVEKDGTLSEVKVARGIDPLLDAEAVRAVSTLKFRPGRLDGKPVRCRFMIPVNFRLTDTSDKTETPKA